MRRRNLGWRDLDLVIRQCWHGRVRQGKRKNVVSVVSNTYSVILGVIMD